MSIKALAWNSHSVKNKKPELTQFVDQNRHEILLLSETWLQTSDNFSLDNFNSYRIDRHRGGVAILIHKDVPHSSVSKISLSYAEALSLIIHDPAGDYSITVVYISPAASRAQSATFFNNVLSVNGPAIITGDFNSKHTAWNNSTRNNTDLSFAKGKDLFDICNQKRFAIHKPESATLLPPTGKPSVVDFAISKGIAVI